MPDAPSGKSSGAPPAESAYYASLARSRGSAGALLLDAHDRVLLAKPSYKPVWDLPGGVIDAGESPRETCLREVAEELALTPVLDRLIGVIWIPPWPPRAPSNVFVFGGRISAEEAAGIRMRPEEIADYGFFGPDDQLPPMERLTVRKVTTCAAGLRNGETVYYEEHEKPGWYGTPDAAPTRVETR
ncbi:NUDIX domain-containing protein [Streptomyces iconiensis]|uniref:NUDIX hydrolase n=1 Tax=Streptomyces iconiensis TaxID=1384038 RepID=A0ABT6ZX31_9ACTN|nr:NUDIX hydrolase [Streptomyces iconiensis]MDJ1133623.1 NUDIX hydrolase [Streptomyces iconiensis]